MKYTLLFLLGVLVGACSTPRAATAPASDPFDRREAATELESKTVALLMGGASHCSGVWVSPWSFVTAHHCVAALSVGTEVRYTVHAELFPGFKAKAVGLLPYRVAVVSAIDPPHDLALMLAILPPHHGVAALYPGVVERGSFTQTMSHPEGLWYSYSTGIVAGVREHDTGEGPTTYVQSTAPISHGSSGCGLFDTKGRLIGIGDAVVDGGQSLNLFTHVSSVRAFLDAQGAF
jgi:S1-C subfamily serine protease